MFHDSLGYNSETLLKDKPEKADIEYDVFDLVIPRQGWEEWKSMRMIILSKA